MPLATISDVEERLGRSLSPSEDTRVNGLLDEASDLVIGYLGPVSLDPVPDVVRRVTSRLVARLFEAPTGQVGIQGQQFTAGPYQMSNTFVPDSRSGSPYLAKADRISLRSVKLGAFSVRTY